MLVGSVPSALVGPRLAALADHLPGALQGQGRAVHQARVASRRLREVLPVVGPRVGARRLGRAMRRVRQLTRALGPVRELDVTLALLAGLAVTQASLAPAIRVVRRVVTAERERRRDAMHAALGDGQGDRTCRAVARVADRLAADPDDEGWRRVLALRAVERADTLEGAMEDVGLLFDPARLHAVRIAAKKLRYTLEMAGEARVATTAPLVRTLKRLQEQLGRLHDLQVLLVFARSPEIDAVPRNRKPLAALSALVERECLREHARYLRSRTRIFGVCQHVRDAFDRPRTALSSEGSS
jgi:CHAD domain-containing protein